MRDEFVLWLRKFVEALRSRVREEPSLADGLLNLDWFLEPCQITALWFVEPEVQVLIVTHFDDVEDLAIDVYGPAPTYNFVEIATKVVEKDWWNRKPVSGKKTYREQIEWILAWVKHLLEEAIFMEPTMQILSKHIIDIGSKDFLWRIRGSLLSFDVNELVDEIIADAQDNLQGRKKGLESISKERISREKSEEVAGYGTYIFPFLWLAEPPELTLQQKLKGIVYPFEVRKIVKEFEVLGSRVVLFNDGFVFVEAKSKRLALKVINLFLASMLLNGIQVYACREADLASASLGKGGLFSTVGAEYWSMRLKGLFSPEVLMERLSALELGVERTVGVDELERVIDTLRRVSARDRVATLSVALLKTFTYLRMGDLREAFVNGWAVVEYHVTMLWESLLEGLDGERRRKLRDSNYMNMDRIIEALNLFNKIDDETYKWLMRLKKTRNKVIHKLKDPPKNEVEELYEKTHELILHLIRQQP